MGEGHAGGECERGWVRKIFIYPLPRPCGPRQPPTASCVDRSLPEPSFVSAPPPCSKDFTSTVEREEQGRED